MRSIAETGKMACSPVQQQWCW